MIEFFTFTLPLIIGRLAILSSVGYLIFCIADGLLFAIECQREAKKRCETLLTFKRYYWIRFRMFFYDWRRASLAAFSGRFV